MTPDLRLIRYFVAVAEEGNITRAAERLHIAQPSLSAAIKQLEGQLGVELLARYGRRVTVTSVGELLLRRGRELLEHADDVAAEVGGRSASASGRLRLGLSPTARFGVGPELLAACAMEVPAIMLYTSEDTTGALLRGVDEGTLDLAVTFCASARPGVDLTLLRDEPAVVHLPSGHRLAGRGSLTLPDLADETVLIAASNDSSGFSARVLGAFADQGITPHTRVDPYPDLGLQAVRDGLGIVVYVRSAYPDALGGSAFVELCPPFRLPFHLATREGTTGSAIRAIQAIGRGLSQPDQPHMS